MKAKFVYESLNEKKKFIKKVKPKLTAKDKKVLELLLDENLNEGKMDWKKFFPKFKKAVGKGLITTALLLSLMSSNAFGQDQKEALQQTFDIEMSDQSGDELEGGGDDFVQEDLKSAAEDIKKHTGNETALKMLSAIANFEGGYNIGLGDNMMEIESVNVAGGGNSMSVIIDYSGGAQHSGHFQSVIGEWLGDVVGLEGGKYVTHEGSTYNGDNFEVTVSEKDAENVDRKSEVAKSSMRVIIEIQNKTEAPTKSFNPQSIAR